MALLWYLLYFDVNLVLSCPCLAAKRSSAFNNIELISLVGAIKLALRRGWTLRSVPFDASHSSETAIDGIKNCWGASSCSQCKDLHNVCAQFNIGIEPRLEKIQMGISFFVIFAYCIKNCHTSAFFILFTNSTGSCLRKWVSQTNICIRNLFHR